jgi:hypothetical protein
MAAETTEAAHNLNVAKGKRDRTLKREISTAAAEHVAAAADARKELREKNFLGPEVTKTLVRNAIPSS